MKALVFHSPKHVTVDQVADPRIEQPRDAVLRVTATAICGSDLHIYNGAFPQPRALVLGHEFMGVVEELGAGVTNLKVGDRVVVPFPIACSWCSTAGLLKKLANVVHLQRGSITSVELAMSAARRTRQHPRRVRHPLRQLPARAVARQGPTHAERTSERAQLHRRADGLHSGRQTTRERHHLASSAARSGTAQLRGLQQERRAVHEGGARPLGELSRT